MNEIDWGHIWERFFTHIPMDAGFVLLTIVGLLFIQRRKWMPTLPAPWFYFLAGFLPMAIAWFREPWDVWDGQHIVKVVTDWISHLAHWGWVYLLYRFGPTLEDLSTEMKNWKDQHWWKKK